MTYLLMRYDDPILQFDMMRTLDDTGQPEFEVSILHTFDTWNALHPLNLKLSSGELKKWISKRAVPNNRFYVSEILKKLGLDIRDKIGVIEISNGLSLNDSYWVWNEDNGKPFGFDKINLYDHNFSEVLGAMVFDGHGTKSNPKMFGSSPEYTTGGMLAKAWRRINGKIFLYKSGTEGFSNAGNEPYSEYYAYQIAQKMGLRAIAYDLTEWKGKLCTSCELFTSKSNSFIYIGSIIQEGGMLACLEYYKKLGENYYQQLVSMLVFDALIVNSDRHFGNFGLLIDSNNKVFDTAPIFDNGLGLVSMAMQTDFENIQEYIADHPPAGGYNNFVEFVKPLISDVQRAQLAKLENFTFERHPKYNLPEWRLDKLDKLVKTQRERLLS